MDRVQHSPAHIPVSQVKAKTASLACMIHMSAIKDGHLVLGAELREVKILVKGMPTPVGIMFPKNHVISGSELTVMFQRKRVTVQLAAESTPKPEVLKQVPQNFTLSGLPVSAGYAVGQVSIMIPGEKAPVEKRELSEEKIEPEVARFNRAVSGVKTDYAVLIKGAEAEAKTLLEGQVMMIEEVASNVEALIRNEKCNAEFALHTDISRRVKFFSSIVGEELFREKALDYQGFGSMIAGHLSGSSHKSKAGGEPVILAAKEFTPDVVLSGKKILALIAEEGGPTSHAAIVAKGFGIPAVLGVKGLIEAIREGTLVLVDGLNGTVVLNPSAERTEQLLALKHQHDAYTAKVRGAVAGRRSVTLDDHQVNIGANLFSVRQFAVARSFEIDMVGLVRTEGDVLDRSSLPTEDELTREYSSIVDIGAVFRMLDLGGDKIPKHLAKKLGLDQREDNPLLGMRGIRLYNSNEAWREIFNTQVRATLRASAVNPGISIMFPMVSKLHEFRSAKQIVHQQMEQLTAKRAKFNPNIKIGVMAEVPSVVYFARQMAKEADFINIGTNDMLQYMFAIARGNARVAGLYDPFLISLIPCIRQIIEAAHGEKKPVCLCGDMGADPIAVLVLAGLGIDSLSMSPSEVPNAKYVLTSMNYQQVRKFTLGLFTDDGPLLSDDGKTSARTRLRQTILDSDLPLDMIERINLVGSKFLAKPAATT